MKWLLALVVAALLLAFVHFERQSVKTTYVNGLTPYTNLPGREFILERDCYIFKFKARDSSWPLFASQVTVPELPADVKDSNVGADVPDIRILDVLHVGDLFRIVSVRRDESRAGTFITFEVLLADESSRKYPRLDAYWIMDHSPEKNGAAPEIMTAYAVPRGRE
jgi:hypothetical protein